MNDLPKCHAGFAADYMKAPTFTNEMNNELVPSNLNSPSYSLIMDKVTLRIIFISPFHLYWLPDSVICWVLSIFLQETVRKLFWSLELRSISSLEKLVDKSFINSSPLDQWPRRRCTWWIYIKHLMNICTRTSKSLMKKAFKFSIQIYNNSCSFH